MNDSAYSANPTFTRPTKLTPQRASIQSAEVGSGLPKALAASSGAWMQRELAAAGMTIT